MFKKIDGPPELKAKHEARCKLKECKKKTRPKDEFKALQEEVAELREIIEILAKM